MSDIEANPRLDLDHWFSVANDQVAGSPGVHNGKAGRWLHLAVATSLAFAAGAPALAQTDQSPWNGFYVGGVLGGAWGHTKAQAQVTTGRGVVVIPPADAAAFGSLASHDETKAGFTGGVEGGYNYQMGNWLFGVEGDWTALNLQNTNNKTLQSTLLTNPTVTFFLNQRVKTDWMVSLRPRVGYVMGPWMVFATTGLAWSELKYSADFTDTRSPGDALTASSSSTKTGWAAGLGGAYAFSPRVSFKGEWLYADFGHIGTAVTNNFVSITPRDSVQTHMFRFGVDYRF
jgi:outer membrane immunogenic protein